MVHKHDATRLHDDLRLEIDGVLVSWAIPKGPSYDPADKRLAVQTEDHPLAYATFEGRIPDGAYGAGDSLLWEEGTFDTVPPGQASEQLARGRLHVVLHGQVWPPMLATLAPVDATADADWRFEVKYDGFRAIAALQRGRIALRSRTLLARDVVKKPPVKDAPSVRDALHDEETFWVKPRYVAQVAFTEWTEDGRLRPPSFQGLRGDKRPEECVRERPRSTPVRATRGPHRRTGTKVRQGTRAAGRTAVARKPSTRAPGPVAPVVLTELDPGEGTFDDLIQLATSLRRYLEGLELTSVPKTSGKRGLHVLVPLAPGHTYAQAGAFANRAFEALAAEHPRLDPTRFTLDSLRRRLDKVGDLFAPALAGGQTLPSA